MSPDFRKTFREGRRFLSPRFALYIRKNGEEAARFGMSVSKGHLKLATRRNRLRRVAKEFFRKEFCHDFKGHDFVVASRRRVTKADFNEAVKELTRLLGKVLS